MSVLSHEGPDLLAERAAVMLRMQSCQYVCVLCFAHSKSLCPAAVVTLRQPPMHGMMHMQLSLSVGRPWYQGYAHGLFACLHALFVLARSQLGLCCAGFGALCVSWVVVQLNPTPVLKVTL